MAVLRVKIRCRMRGDNLPLGFALANHLLDAVAHGNNHVGERLHARAIGLRTARRDNVKLWIRPAQLIDKTLQRAALRRVDARIAIAGEYFAKINDARHVKMGHRVGVAETWLLMNDVNGFAVDVEGIT